MIIGCSKCEGFNATHPQAGFASYTQSHKRTREVENEG